MNPQPPVKPPVTIGRISRGEGGSKISARFKTNQIGISETRAEVNFVNVNIDFNYQTFDEISEDLKILENDSNKVNYLLDYYNLNQDICINSIASLTDSFNEIKKKLIETLNQDLEKIAEKKYREYLMELEELNKDRREAFQKELNALSMKHYQEIQTYVRDIDVKQKELQDQIDNFEKLQEEEFEKLKKKDFEDQKDELSKFLNEMNHRNDIKRLSNNNKPRRLQLSKIKEDEVKEEEFEKALLNSISPMKDKLKENLWPNFENKTNHDILSLRERRKLEHEKPLPSFPKKESYENDLDSIRLERVSDHSFEPEREKPIPPPNPAASTDRRSGYTQRSGITRGNSSRNVNQSVISRDREVAMKPSWASKRGDTENTTNNEMERTSGRNTPLPQNSSEADSDSEQSREHVARPSNESATSFGNSVSSSLKKNSSNAREQQSWLSSESGENSSRPSFGGENSRPSFGEHLTRHSNESSASTLLGNSSGLKKSPSITREQPSWLTSDTEQSRPSFGGENSFNSKRNQQQMPEEEEQVQQLLRNSGSESSTTIHPASRKPTISDENESEQVTSPTIIPRVSKRLVPLRSAVDRNNNNVSTQITSTTPAWKKKPMEEIPPSSVQREDNLKIPDNSITNRAVLRRNLNEQIVQAHQDSEIKNKTPLSPRTEVPKNWQKKATDLPPTPTIPLTPNPNNISVTSNKTDRTPSIPQTTKDQTEPIDTFEKYAMVSCGLCKLTFEEVDTVLLKEVSKRFCQKCAVEVIERAKTRGLTLTRV